MIISRLSDGTLLRFSEGGKSETWDGSNWVPDDSVSLSDASASASKPLTEAEIAELVSEGILPTKTLPKSQIAFSNSGQKAPPGSGFRDLKEFNQYFLKGLDKR